MIFIKFGKILSITYFYKYCSVSSLSSLSDFSLHPTLEWNPTLDKKLRPIWFHPYFILNNKQFFLLILAVDWNWLESFILFLNDGHAGSTPRESDGFSLECGLDIGVSPTYSTVQPKLSIMVIEAGCSGIASTLVGLIDHWGWGQGWDTVVTLPRYS